VEGTETYGQAQMTVLLHLLEWIFLDLGWEPPTAMP
jgi:hypothetical protein